MEATTWKGGGESFGIRVGHENAEKYFKKEWTDVEVKIGNKFQRFNLAMTFWTKCPEIRGVEIKKWLEKKNMHRWNRNMPYVLDLEPLGYKRFELIDPGDERRTKKIDTIDFEIEGDE
jgi:hypothetical protein